MFHPSRIQITLATAAAILLAGNLPQAGASVVTTNQSTTLSSTNTYAAVNVPGGAVDGYWGSNSTSFFNTLLHSGTVSYLGDGTNLFNLSSGTSLGPATAGTWSNSDSAGQSNKSAGSYSGNFPTGSGYFGFRFVDPNNAGQYEYGYMGLTQAPDASSFTLGNFSYETADNTAITVGAVPETSSAIMGMASAALALATRRRR